MKIELKRITVKELFDGYADRGEEGVVGYGGSLNIRPPYQREFVYKDAQRDEVIKTILKGYPLNIMYWAVNEDGTYELLDGQQRTVSICKYLNNEFSINHFYYHALPDDIRAAIDDYELHIYLCSGEESEKLDWFEIVNIAGEKLTQQELRNSVYTGSWLADAKRWFSKRDCPAYQIANRYINGSAERQDYLETAIKWAVGDSDAGIREYMSARKNDPDANELWTHFDNVIKWIDAKFNYRKEMKGLDWGRFYAEYNESIRLVSRDQLEGRVAELMLDEEVTSKKGIYEYILSEDERHLNLRAFSDAQKREMYETQDGICKHCNERFALNQMEGDHITPWVDGGKTDIVNGQMLCKDCNRRKGAQ